jgi:hypothetical protein
VWKEETKKGDKASYILAVWCGARPPRGSLRTESPLMVCKWVEGCVPLTASLATNGKDPSLSVAARYRVCLAYLAEYIEFCDLMAPMSRRYLTGLSYCTLWLSAVLDVFSARSVKFL